VKSKLLLMFVVAIGFAACGDSDGGANTSTNAGTAALDEVYASEDDLPGCIEKYDGAVAFVKEGSTAFKCEDGRWENKGEYYANNEAIKNCTEKREGEIAYIVDEDKSLVCEDGKWVKASAKVPEPAERTSSSSSVTLSEVEGSSASNAASSSLNEVTGSSSSSKDKGGEPAERSSSSKEKTVSNSSSSHKDNKDESSSSVVSSSSVKSSSSAKVPEPADESSSSAKSPDSSAMSSSSEASGVSYGVLTDSRDGKTYRTVKIGTQEWMAENLNVNTFDSRQWGPWCKDASKNCEKYGRYFDYETAQNACPEGWRLPNITEWQILADAVGGIDVASKMLKSATSWNGENAYGFNALPAGVSAPRDYGQTINVFDEGDVAEFWSVDYWVVGMSISYPNVALIAANYLTEGRSVRCLKGTQSVVSSSSSVRSSSSAKSSSSSVQSSSSSVQSSSSIDLYVLPASVELGYMTDSRDNQRYKTVKIGTQIWMAQNLNYETGTNQCVKDDDKNCSKYGRLYNWVTAINKEESKCGYQHNCFKVSGDVADRGYQGVCPYGWHLPNIREADTLINATGGGPWDFAKNLRSTSGWNDNKNGVDAYYFTVLPTGFGYYAENRNVGTNAYFWLYAEGGSDDGYSMWVTNGSYASMIKTAAKWFKYSVRCIKD